MDLNLYIRKKELGNTVIHTEAISCLSCVFESTRNICPEIDNIVIAKTEAPQSRMS